MGSVFLEWHQIGKWLFDGSDNGDIPVTGETTSTNPNWYGINRFTNLADTPLLKMSAVILDSSGSNVTSSGVNFVDKAKAVVTRENDITFVRCRFTEKYTREQLQTTTNARKGYCGLRIMLDKNKTEAFDYPVLVKYKMRINNPANVDGFSPTGNYKHLFDIKKVMVDGQYKLCFVSPVTGTEISYPFSQKILDGEWFDVEILWTPEKETLRIDGWSIGSDEGTKSNIANSPLGKTNNKTEFNIITSYNCENETPDFDISQIEVSRIYERYVTSPSIRITSEVIDDTTVRLTANGYTGHIPEYVQEEEPEPEQNPSSNNDDEITGNVGS